MCWEELSCFHKIYLMNHQYDEPQSSSACISDLIICAAQIWKSDCLVASLSYAETLLVSMWVSEATMVSGIGVIADIPSPFLLDWEPQCVFCQHGKSVGTRTGEHCQHWLWSSAYPASSVLVDLIKAMWGLHLVALLDQTMGIFFLHIMSACHP